SGAGGGAVRSIVAHGEYVGRSISDVVHGHGEELFGKGRAARAFPLLVKFLDAGGNLSVQVHPSPEYAAAHPDAHLKTESWYIVEAEVGAKIYKGVREGVTRDQFARAIADNTVMDLMIAIDVRAGDFHHLPSGTCHALGGGIVVAEVQTPSDTTFRVYDWGRTDRQLHIEQSLECIEFGPPARLDAIRGEAGARETLLESNDYYELTERRFAPGEVCDVHSQESARIWMVMNGRGRIETEGGGVVALSLGSTTLIPAICKAGDAVFSEETTILEARAV
ncbi:MAG: type I phosphomannose isomerase catalytic subunit, partial [Planctomycetota bacterium]